MRPCGPTTKGRESAFQLPLAVSSLGKGVQVLPSSRLMSEPLVPAVIQAFRSSLQATEER